MEILPFDISIIKNLSGGDTSFEIELLELFRTESKRQFEELGGAIRAQSQEDIWRKAHKLKGSCIQMGAKACYQLLVNIETAGKQGNLAEASRLHGELDEALVFVNQQMGDYINSLN